MLPWLLFVRLANEVWEGEGLPGDRRLLMLFHAHRGPAQDAVAAWLSQAGGPVGAAGLAGKLEMSHRITPDFGTTVVRAYGAST